MYVWLFSDTFKYCICKDEQTKPDNSKQTAIGPRSVDKLLFWRNNWKKISKTYFIGKNISKQLKECGRFE